MGDGVLPMRRYLEELDAAGYEGYISLEVMNDRYYRNPEKGIEQSVQFLRDFVQTDNTDRRSVMIEDARKAFKMTEEEMVYYFGDLYTGAQ